MNRLRNSAEKDTPLFIRCEANGEIIFVSENSKSFLGINSDALTGKSVFTILSENVFHFDGKSNKGRTQIISSHNDNSEFLFFINKTEYSPDKFEVFLVPFVNTSKPKDEWVHIIEGGLHDLNNYLNNFIDETAIKESELNVSTLLQPIVGIIKNLEEKMDDRVAPIELIKPELDIFPVIQLAFRTNPKARKMNLIIENGLKQNWYSSSSKLLRIFNNLLDNIFKHSEASEVVVQIAENEKDWVKVVVKDNGKGMQRDVLEKASTDLQLEGIKKGLGIGIVAELVNDLGGKIISYGGSEGTDVHMVFPLNGRDENFSSDIKIEASLEHLKSMTLYVLDDQALSIKVVEAMLTPIFASVKSFKHGDELFQALLSKVPDIIMIDISLENERGDEIAERITIEHGHNTPILLACTGYSSKNMKVDLMSNGFDSVVVKPLEPENLLQIISQTTDNTYSRREVVTTCLKDYSFYNKNIIAQLNEIAKADISEDLWESFEKELQNFNKKSIHLNNFAKSDDFFRILHTLKSSAGTLGYTRLEKYLKFLEIEHYKRAPETKDFQYLKTLINEIMSVIKK